MKPSVIVWDLETVPDLGGFAAANDLVGKSDVEVREAIGDRFPKHIYHSIVCIGALIAHWELDHWAVDAIGAPHVAERTEKQLIAAFCDKIAELSPRLVTFNGNSFDLPVLRYRAMIHGVSAPSLSYLGGFAAANDLVGKSDVEVREAIGDKFPKHIYHSIVCIGALIAHWEPDHWAVDAIGAPHVGERTEKQLIAAFCDKIAELSPQLVTFNGNSFDLPVLRYRAMIHGVSAPGLSVRPYFNRYTEDAIDLCDALSSFSPQRKGHPSRDQQGHGLAGEAEGDRWWRGGALFPRR